MLWCSPAQPTCPSDSRRDRPVFRQLLAKLYWLSPLAAVVVLALFLQWTPSTGLRGDISDLEVGRGEQAPHHQQADSTALLVGDVFILTANATLYTSLLFGGLFLCGFPPRTGLHRTWISPFPLFPSQPRAASSSPRSAHVSTTGKSSQTPLGLAVILIGCLMVTLSAAAIGVAIPGPETHAASASALAVVVYVGLHASIGGIFASYGLWRWYSGYHLCGPLTGPPDRQALARLHGPCRPGRLGFPFVLQSLSEIGGGG